MRAPAWGSWSRVLKKFIWALTAAASIGAGAAQSETFELPTGAALAEQEAVFAREAPGSIFGLQPYRASVAVSGEGAAEIRLTSLNPQINSWFVLSVGSRSYHLENADPLEWSFWLDGAGAEAALVISGEAGEIRCQPWAGASSELGQAAASGLPFAPICADRAFVRNRVSGSRTSREAVAEFLRDNVSFGDSLVNLIKGSLYEDAFMQTSDEGDPMADAGAVVAALGRAQLDRFPVLFAASGFDLIGAEGGMEAGSWYAIDRAPGIYASIMQPGLIAQDILGRWGETNWLDGVESRADVYLVAFDLDEFDVGYELGTDHPGLGWSSRPSGAGRDWSIAGPDGISSPAPLVMTGMLSPALTDRVAATFTGGYKREHGAFRFGDMAYFNHGHHYGFYINGVTLSRLQPGLSTVIVMNDGTVDMRTWTEEDNALLPDLRFARQNGVPLIENGVPGDRVTLWGPGNWSGSADAQLRTLRGGACIRDVEGRPFLIYAYFSTATPSAMARTFQAYGCDYAMLLDMNSQEHTYMALYPEIEDGGWIEAQHLVQGMAVVDQRSAQGTIPRFVGFADNRDFFYLLRRQN